MVVGLRCLTGPTSLLVQQCASATKGLHQLVVFPCSELESRPAAAASVANGVDAELSQCFLLTPHFLVHSYRWTYDRVCWAHRPAALHQALLVRCRVGNVLVAISSTTVNTSSSQALCFAEGPALLPTPEALWSPVLHVPHSPCR